MKNRIIPQPIAKAANNRAVGIDDLWPKVKRSHRYNVAAISQLTEADYHELIRRVKKRLGSGPGEILSTAEKRNRHRFLHKLKRRFKGKTGKGRPTMSQLVLASVMKHCPIMDSLVTNRDKYWVKPKLRKKSVKISLINFSILKHPAESLASLHAIAVAEGLAAEQIIDFDDIFCEDVSPYLVLGLMRQNMLPVAGGGNITPAIRSMIDTVGLRKFLFMNALRTDKNDPTFFPFHVRHRRKAGTTTSSDRAFQPSTFEKLSDDLNNTITGWFRLLGRPELTNEGKAKVAGMVSEALDNAERHSDLNQDGDWAIAGFLSVVRGQESTDLSFVCSLGIVSVGATISESMAACEDPVTLGKIKSYIARHGRRGKFSPELLTTVYAIQDRVSRFKQGDDRSKGGVGLMDMIQFVNEIGETDRPSDQPQLTLVSGSSCIKIMGAFHKATQPGPNSARRLWFNPANSLDHPPDSDYVLSLPYFFPGTVVAIRFCIAAAFLEPTSEQ